MPTHLLWCQPELLGHELPAIGRARCGLHLQLRKKVAVTFIMSLYKPPIELIQKATGPQRCAVFKARSVRIEPPVAPDLARSVDRINRKTGVNLDISPRPQSLVSPVKFFIPGRAGFPRTPDHPMVVP